MIRKLFSRLYQFIASYLRTKWDAWKPFFQKVWQTLSAIWTATTTFKFALQIMPIVLSILTVLMTLPLMNYFLPSFFLNTYILLAIMVGICAFAGWCKYKELQTRSTLDEQIIANKNEINGLKKEITELQKTLKKYRTFVNSFPSFRGQITPTTDAFQNTITTKDKPFIRPTP